MLLNYITQNPPIKNNYHKKKEENQAYWQVKYSYISSLCSLHPCLRTVCLPTFLNRNSWLLLSQSQQDEEEDQWNEELKGQHPLEGKERQKTDALDQGGSLKDVQSSKHAVYAHGYQSISTVVSLKQSVLLVFHTIHLYMLYLSRPFVFKVDILIHLGQITTTIIQKLCNSAMQWCSSLVLSL